MKVVKPLKLGVIHRPYERAGRYYLAVAASVFFTFDQPDLLLPEITMWPFAATALGKDAMLDAGMPKQHGEVLIKAKCFTTKGAPRSGMEVRWRVGAIEKKLYVLGDRTWRRKLGSWQISEPKPFSEMEITWAHSFGGSGYERNPLGKGFKASDQGQFEGLPLPNIEDPKQPLSSPTDRPLPAGFEPLDLVWPQRFAKMGTYDDRWLKEKFPYFANDLDWTIFNVAAPDQWLNGYFEGGEAIELEGMHKEKPLIKTRLPRVRVRAFINQNTSDGLKFRELSTVADTCWLFPQAERGILIFRSVCDIATDDTFDVMHLVVGAEAMGSPRPVDHYKTVLEQRLDRKIAHKWLLRDDLLLPAETEKSTAPPSEIDKMTELVAPKLVAFKRMKANVEKQLAGFREKAEQASTRIVGAGGTALNVAELDKFNEMLELLPTDGSTAKIDVDALAKKAEEASRQADEVRLAADKKIREQLKTAGIDYDELLKSAGARMPGPPPEVSIADRFKQLRKQRDDFRAAGLDDPELNRIVDDPSIEAKFSADLGELGDSYRSSAHHLTDPAKLPAVDSARIRMEVQTAIQKRASLAGRNLSGADLSKLDLRGANLLGTYLEACNLSNANLANTNLSGAVLARANLKGAILKGANLLKSNLGKADLRKADLSETDLKEAILFEADLREANLTRAKLDKANVMRATLVGANFSEVSFPGALFLELNLDGARFTGANLEKAMFLTCSMNKIDFSGARMKAALFLTCSSSTAVFKNANLENLRAVQGCSFPGADLSGSNLTEASMRGTDLKGANLGGCNLPAADFSEANLSKANLSGVVAKQLRMIRTDLTGAKLAGSNFMDAVVQKALTAGADFSNSNLYRADVLKMVVDANTKFRGANLKRTLLQDLNH
jgi:uncharacterized protein YjbI with pentapeptide repeats